MVSNGEIKNMTKKSRFMLRVLFFMINYVHIVKREQEKTKPKQKRHENREHKRDNGPSY